MGIHLNQFEDSNNESQHNYSRIDCYGMSIPPCTYRYNRKRGVATAPAMERLRHSDYTNIDNYRFFFSNPVRNPKRARFLRNSINSASRSHNATYPAA